MLIDFRPSRIHGTGGFALTAISPGTRIIEYLGERINKQESVRQCQSNNHFIFYWNDEFDLNGNVDWNPARFLNHCCEPNAEAIFTDGQIWIVATCLIELGEEVTFDYGYDLAAFREYPCACGAKSCLGFIVGEPFRAEARRMLEARQVLGPELPTASAGFDP